MDSRLSEAIVTARRASTRITSPVDTQRDESIRNTIDTKNLTPQPKSRENYRSLSRGAHNQLSPKEHLRCGTSQVPARGAVLSVFDATYSHRQEVEKRHQDTQKAYSSLGMKKFVSTLLTNRTQRSALDNYYQAPPQTSSGSRSVGRYKGLSKKKASIDGQIRVERIIEKLRV